MPKATDVVRILDGEARRIGAARRIGLRRELAQRRLIAALAVRPQPHGRVRLARLAEPGLGQRDHGFLLAAMREPRHRLAERDDLSGLRQRRRDDAVGVGLEVAVGELVAREIERAPGAFEPAFGFVLRPLLAVEVGDRRVAARAQRRVALEIGRRLREVRGRGGMLGLRRFRPAASGPADRAAPRRRRRARGRRH